VVKCGICGASANFFSEYKGINRDKEFLVKAFSDKAVWCCPDCHYCFCHPWVEFKLLKDYYESCFWEKGGKLSRNLLAELKKLVPGIIARRLRGQRPLDEHLQSLISLLERFIDEKGGVNWLRGNYILEIGAGAANISSALLRHYNSRGASLKSHVVEPSDQFKHIYRWDNLRKIANTFEEMDESLTYMVILSQHWLEHVIDLNSAFLKLKRLLKEDGLLFLEVPNCEDPYWEYRFYPNPPHVHFFTPKSLKLLAEKYNFQVLSLMTYGRPIEWEKDVGYLKPDTPALLSASEIRQLETERELKSKLFFEGLKRENWLGKAEDYWGNAYRESGREWIRLIATRNRGGKTYKLFQNLTYA
jgi:2-polyprenyl-3-methyl-5-hydroxy-6-metoxy-1,4-benzoquinol methylase